MDIIGISAINEAPELSSNDMLHIIRSNEYSFLLSYKEKAKELSDVFQDASIVNSLMKEINTLTSQLKTISSSILTRSSAKSTYVLKDIFEAQKSQLLTYDEMQTIIAKYVTDDDMKNKAAQARAESHKLADEMTDFAGAAMVGINQSNASFAPVSAAAP